MTACTTTVNTDTTRSATLTSVFPSPSDASTPATPIRSHKSSQKPKLRPRLNPRELNRKISTLLSSALFHRRPDRDPVPPSLAYSRLPPPCAELDPSPKYRIRRFKKWRDQVPELRMALLDPKRRGHLVRYQTYAVPCTSAQQRGVKRKIFPRGCEIRDYAAWPTIESIRTHRSKTTAPRQGKPVSVASAAPAPPRKAIPVKPAPNGTQRRQVRIRLKQHRWILHAENERRWRQGMREVMASVVWFQDRCMLEPSKWKDGKGVWLPDYDLDEVTHLTELFRDIRRNPSKVFELSPTIEPVKGRREAEMAVKANESERSRRKEERRQKRAESTSSTDIAKPTPTSLTSSTHSAPKTEAVSNSQGDSKTAQGPGKPQARSSKTRERSDVTRAGKKEAEGMRVGRMPKETSSTLSRAHSAPRTIASLDQPTHSGISLVSHISMKRPSRRVRLGSDPQTAAPALPRALSSSTPRSKTSRSPDDSPTGSRRAHTTSATNHSPVISEANQASLFRLLRQMSKPRTTSERVVRTETAARIHLPERRTQPRRTPKSSNTDGSPRLGNPPSVSGGKSRTANRSDRPNSPITPSTQAITSVPSLASSSSAIQTTVKPRPYSLIIDDDTLDVDADTLITPLSSISLSVNQAQTYQAWSTGGKDGENADMIKIRRYMRVLGLYDESDISDDAPLVIHLSSNTDGGDTARSGSTFDTFRSY